MEWFDLSPDDRDKLSSACKAEGVEDSYTSFVARHLDMPDRGWRWCCGSSCDPCVQSLGRAVDRARKVLGIEAPESPLPAENARSTQP
ncbi:MAG: hypothetical protein AB8H80_18870 [Planctomycetota bacterium]